MATNLFDNNGVALTDESGNIVLAKGATVPADGTAGYALGGVYIRTGSAGGQVRWINNGSGSSSAFTPTGSSIGGSVLVEDFAAAGARADSCSVISAAFAAGSARVVTTNVANHIYTPGGNKLCAWNIVQQDIAPVMVTTGLDIGCDQTASDGMEINSHCYGATGSPFIIGTSPAFYFKCTITIADVSGINPLFIGFRQIEAANVTLASYGTYAGIGWNTAAATAAIKLIGENDGVAHTNYPIDTTNTCADGATKVFGVYVDTSGNTTYTINGVAPTTTGAGNFDDGDQVIPVVHYLQSAASPSAVVIGKWDVGYV